MALREKGLLSEVKETITTLRDPNAVVLPHNPTGRVPALLLGDGLTLTETTLILKWLDRFGDRPTLLSDDPRDLAAYGRALGLLDGIAVWNRELRRPPSERSPSVLSLESTRANRIADTLDKDVNTGAYSVTNASMLALLSVLGYAQRRHTVWQWWEGRPNLEQWFKKASALESFAQTLPPPSGI
jgi:glutathione S-transferase